MTAAKGDGEAAAHTRTRSRTPDAGAGERPRARPVDIARDVVSMGDAGATFGFGIAKRATTAGFTLASLFVRRNAVMLEQACGPNAVSQTLRNADTALDVAHRATRASQDLAHVVTILTLQAAKAELDQHGAREGQLLRMAVGEEAAEALIVVQSIVQRFAGPLIDVPLPQLLAASRSWRAAQKASQQLRGEAGEALPGLDSSVTASELEHWMRFSCASFGAEMLSGLVDGVPGALDAMSRKAAQREGRANSGEFALACAGLRGRFQVLEFQNSRRALFEPGYLVCLDFERNCVVIALRGTSSAADVLADLVCEPEELELGGMPGLAHGGMLKAARRLAGTLAEIAARGLEQLVSGEAGEQPSIVICGHSLGAGVAALIAALWRDFSVFPGVDVRCFAFACPQVLDAELANAVSNHTTSVIVGTDIVPRLSLATAYDLREALLQIRSPDAHGLPESCGTSALLDAESRGDTQALADAHAAIKRSACTSSRRLYPAGLLVLWPPANLHAGPQIASHESVDEILIARDMAGSHMPRNYLLALQNWSRM